MEGGKNNFPEGVILYQYNDSTMDMVCRHILNYTLVLRIWKIIFYGNEQLKHKKIPRLIWSDVTIYLQKAERIKKRNELLHIREKPQPKPPKQLKLDAMSISFQRSVRSECSTGDSGVGLDKSDSNSSSKGSVQMKLPEALSNLAVWPHDHPKAKVSTI